MSAYPVKLREDAADRVLEVSDIHVLFLTCNRGQRPGVHNHKPVAHSENYIHSTLASFFMSDDWSRLVHGVSLVVGGDDSTYLTNVYKHTGQCRIHPMPNDYLTDVQADAHKRVTRAYCRLLRIALDCPAEVKGFLICEDDVVFRDGFWGYAMDAINEMRCLELPKASNTLTFYSRYDYRDKKSFYRGRYVCSAAGDYTGLCGIYFDRDCVKSLLDFMVAHEGLRPADHLYWLWSNKEWTRYATPVGFIQHVGGISTGTSGGIYYWSDPRFADAPHCWDPVWVRRAYEPFEVP